MSKKQSSLSSFFVPKAVKNGEVNTASVPVNDPPKSVDSASYLNTVENVMGSDHKEDNKRIQSSISTGNSRKKVRRIIDDDDDDNEIETKDTTPKLQVENTSKEKEADVDKGLNQNTQQTTGITTSSFVPSKKEIKSLNLAMKHSSKKSDAKETSTSTIENDELLSSNGTGNGPLSYSILCETLSSIEAITSRLEIQKILTRLFQHCLEKSPKDLLPTVYLASNSVAPAYECVELGVGDAILIKAVGEASGTNAGT